MKRICIIDPDSGLGGSSKSIFLALKYIDKKNISISYFCKQSNPNIKLLKSNHISVSLLKTLPRLRSSKNSFLNIIILIKYLFILLKNIFYIGKLNFRLKSFDVIHINNDSVIANFFFLVFFNVKIVTHLRSVLEKDWLSLIQKKLIEKISSKIVLIGKKELNSFTSKEKIEHRKYSLLLNPVEKNVFKKKCKETNSDIILSYFGYYNFNKGQDILIDVAKKLLDLNIKNFKILLIGRLELNKKAKKRLGIKINNINHFKDLVSFYNLKKYFIILNHKNKLSKYYRMTDIYLKTTRELKPWGRDLLEAMSYGVPYIALGDCDFLDKGKSGFLIDNLNIEKMTKVIIKLINNKNLREKMGKAGRNHIKLNFAPKKYAIKLKKIWLE